MAADDPITLPIARPPAAEERRPPFVGIGVPGQRVADDDGVRARIVEAAPRSICDLHAVEPFAGFESERLEESKIPGPVRWGAHAAASLRVRSSARSKSSLMSSMCSMPT